MYCTCSFSKEQNADVVEWILDQDVGVHKINLHIQKGGKAPASDDSVTVDFPAEPDPHCRGAIRFNPVTSRTSGLFIAVLEKEGK